METKKSQLTKIVRTVAVMAIFAGFGFFATQMGIEASSNLSKNSVIALAVVFIPIFFFGIAVHEAGHALAGLWMNFDFTTYIVGPLMWQKEEGTWHFKWNTNINTAGGMVICMPIGTYNLTKRFAVYAAGGPLASLLLSFMTYGLYIVLLPSYPDDQMLPNLLYIIAVLSLIIFIATIVPMRANGFSTDGARVVRLLKGGDSSRLEFLILKLITGASAGIRPRDLDWTDLREAAALAKKLHDPFGVYVLSFMYQSELDRGNIDKAEVHLVAYVKEIESIPKGIHNMVWLDAAFFYAYAKKDLELATQYWQKFEPAALIPKAQIYATKAAINVLKEEKEQAVLHLELAEKEIASMIDRGAGIALLNAITVLKEAIPH
jgi:hypothetical protein